MISRVVRPSARRRATYLGAFVHAAHAGELTTRMVELDVAARGWSRKRCWVLPLGRGQGCERHDNVLTRLVFEPVGLVAGGDEQDRGGVGADAVDLEQARRGSPHEGVEDLVEMPTVGVSATMRRPNVRMASFVAYITVSLPTVGRNAAAVAANWSTGTSRSRSRSSSGAVNPRWRI